MLKRHLPALGANIFGQGVTIIVQVLTVPLLLGAWGAHRFGEWIVLTALCSYLSLLDGGLANAVGNDMTVRMGAADRPGALRVYHGAARWLRIVLLGSVVLIGLLVLAGHWGQWLQITDLSRSEIMAVLLCIGLSTVISLWNGLYQAALRSTGRYAQGIILANATRMLEALGVCAAAWMGCGLVWAAVIQLGARVTGSVIMAHCARAGLGCAPRPDEGEWASVRPLWGPMVGYLLMPLGFACSMQGTVIAVGIIWGPVAAASFTALRTMTRVVAQIGNVFGQAAGPEMSRLFGVGDRQGLVELHMRVVVSTAVFVALAGVTLGVLGESIFAAWTHGHLAFSSTAMWWLIGSSSAFSLWSSLAVVSFSGNRHVMLATFFVVISIVPTIFLFARQVEQGWWIAAAAMCVLDGAMIPCAWFIGKKSIDRLSVPVPAIATLAV